MDRTGQRLTASAATLRESLGIDESVLADIRAAGECLAERVPELIERFYEWLSPLPEFAQFFGSEPALLARVKSHQTAYWRDFLNAKVDDEYVERRRIVGLAHARIDLGLLIYLRAMEFVEAWLIREAEAHESLPNNRPTLSFSIRKLVHFDSAIVVHTYATRTAQLLEEQRERLNRVASVMRAVTEGDLNHQLDMTSSKDLLGRSVNDMVKSLRGIAREMSIIAKGDYSADVAPRSDRDELGTSLQAMTRALREGADQNEQHLWMITSLAELARAMSGNPSVKELSQGVIAYLCRALDAQVGALYVVDNGGGTLRLTGTYAVTEGSGVPARWQVGEGLVGQAAAENRRILVSHMPEDCIRVRWGLGEALPRTLVVVPLVHETDVRGVVEIGSLAAFSERQLELLDRGSPGVGLAINAAETRARLQQLLEESQAQAEELTSQQEELRQVNDALAEQTRTLELQKESLEATESVLRQKAVELEQASRYKSEFLANMSHELRTPLNSSLILAKLLADNKQENLTPEQVNYAQSIYSAGNDLLELINDILDLSKIEAGKIELNVETVAVDRLLADLRHRFGPLTASKDVELSFVVEPGCPETIETDRQRMHQILTNLLSNAVKFTEKGSIRLSARTAPRHVAFTVEDTGIGIPAEQHDVIFEAFRQADGTTNRKFGGTGLGLSICRELSTLLGGEIRLRSTPGKGSAFTLFIPLRSERAAAAPSRGRRAEPALPGPAETRDAAPPSIRPLVEDDRDCISDSRRLVLLVEDDPAFAQILRDLARELDFQCIIAGSADEAMRLASQYRPVAVVLDVGLPDGSGLVVLEALKRDPATRHVPIHVVSAHDNRQLAREMGAVGYVLKPVEREHLVSAFRILEERLSRTVKSVLVVEDDAVQRDAIARLLSADNVHIVAVATAAEALSELRQTTLDCVVLDLMLPDVSGFELLDQMSEDETCSFPPVIVYTARTLSLDDEQRLRRHSKSIIIKSARSPERLLEEVTLFLHQVESELPPDKQRMLKVARDRESSFEGRRILLVEDDIRSIFALTSMLELKGVAVDVARNGKEALARLSEDPSVDLILMDIMMPEMDGLTATREIRKGNGNGSTSPPIIALTAKAMPDDREQCLAAGANDYIAKPIDTDKLLSLLRVWMPR
jgi:CheY-like chemotaxis protein/signal transduction histidine kinase